MQCQCCDPGCPTKHGSQCQREAVELLYRSDYEPQAAFHFCRTCADDCMESGFFSTRYDYYAPERGFRALTYLPNGQRFHGWLPSGPYVQLGVCEVEGCEAVKMLSGSGEVWYVGRVSFECRDVQRPIPM